MDAVVAAPSKEYWRTLLVLGRASNLPTVWSNCIAGWLLGGGGSIANVLLVCLAGSCLYIGGMYLNDAFDVEFDRQHRGERPIPSGAISLAAVWGYGIGWIVLGSALTLFLPSPTAGLAAFLVFSIVLYDAVHKLIAFSPVLMALCRFFLLLMAAATGDEGVTGIALWSAIVLACYIIGLSYVAKSESTRGPLKYWPLLLMAGPLVLAWIINEGAPHAMRGTVLSTILVLWIVRNLRFTYRVVPKNIPRTVSGLLAGIVLVDLLAVGGGSPAITSLFILLFVSALVFQKFIPAT